MATSVTLTGNLTRDPDTRTTSSTSFTRFGLAVNRRWRTTSGEWETKVSFFDVVAFGALGEHAQATLSKGDSVIISGRVEQSTWENAEGERRSRVEVIADDLGPSLRWATAVVSRVPSADSAGLLAA